MAVFGNKVKLTILKGMEAVGQSASNLASNAQNKLQELNLETQRREILSDFPLRAYDLWQKGEKLPEPLDQMLKELNDLDERLGVMRAQRFAKVGEKAEGAESEAVAGEESAAKEPESDAPAPEPAPEPAPDSPAPMDEGETGDNA